MLYPEVEMPCKPITEERFLYITLTVFFYLEAKMPYKPIIEEIFLYITLTDALSESSDAL